MKPEQQLIFWRHFVMFHLEWLVKAASRVIRLMIMQLAGEVLWICMILLQWLINVKLVSIGQQNKVKHILQMQMQYLPETARCIEKCLLKGVSRNSFFISLKILNLIFYHICIIFELFACIRERMMAMKILRGVMLGKYIISFLWFWCDGSYSSCVIVWYHGIYLILYFPLSSKALHISKYEY